MHLKTKSHLLFFSHTFPESRNYHTEVLILAIYYLKKMAAKALYQMAREMTKKKELHVHVQVSRSTSEVYVQQ